ncbi:tail fiber assembly protein [Escherichia coli]
MCLDGLQKEVKAVDTSTAPEISWPELPEV